MLREFAWISRCVLCSGLPRQLLWLCLGTFFSPVWCGVNRRVIVLA